MKLPRRQLLGTALLVAGSTVVLAGCGGGDAPAVDPAATPTTPTPGATTPGGTVGDGTTTTQDLNGDGVPDAQPAGTDLGATASIPDLNGGDIGGGLGAVGDGSVFNAVAVPSDQLPKKTTQDTSSSTTTNPTETTKPDAPTYAGAKISIDGVVHDVDKGGAFPEDNPVFRLLSVNGSSIEIELIAGEFTSGGGSGVLIDKGEQVSLVNASEQLTYRITYLRGIKDDTGISF